MTALQIIIIVVIAAVLLGMGVCLGWILCSRRFSDQIDAALTKALDEEPDPKVAINAAIERLIVKARGASGMRFEISVDDWGPEHGEMRWRWTIWDADRIALAIVEPTGPASIGVEVPVMLGNAPTKMKALDDAMHWVMGEGGTIVVVPSILAAEAQDEHVYEVRHLTGPGRPTTTVDGVEIDGDRLRIDFDYLQPTKVWLDGREVKAKVYRDQMLYADTSVHPLMLGRMEP